ncbi:MAG TPA: crotonase/enoyl-CoA hydratase family protein [Actinophytocola sp.]|nr:crotonase/enoyl-CoA hydratase family protein [Actinophytocola sp.]
MTALVDYRLDGGIATITMDDGKVNVASPVMLAELNAAFDRAEADGAVVLLSGRDGVFSAGFDLKLLRAGGSEALAMVRGGFELAARVLAFPRPVVMACTGHAVAMGLFLLQSGDFRIGVAGPYRFIANEVALGIRMPYPAIAILRQRLTPACLSRAVLLAETFTPDNAVEAGFLDRVVEPDRLAEAARETAEAMLALDPQAHAMSKARLREQTLRDIHTGIETDYTSAGD